VTVRPRSTGAAESVNANTTTAPAATTGAAIDHTVPAVHSLLPMVPDPSGATSIPFGLLFEEPVTGLGPEDFTVGGTSPGWTVGSITGTASAYTVTVVAPEGEALPDEGTVTLSLADSTIEDRAANVGPIEAVEASTTYQHDADAPTVVLYQTPHKSISRADFFDWTVTFSEPVLGFALGDVVLGGPDGRRIIVLARGIAENAYQNGIVPELESARAATAPRSSRRARWARSRAAISSSGASSRPAACWCARTA